MKTSRRVFFRNTLRAALLAALAFAVFLAKRVFDYAGPPTADKDCDFVFPPESSPSEISSNKADPPTKLFQTGGFINDASCLNKTPIYGIAKVTSEDDIQDALLFAQRNRINVTVAGQRHSMGGQSFSESGLVLDMRDFKGIKLNRGNFTLTAQCGATWAQIQPVLDREGLSVKAMQSINVPTVGGTLSVNAHGIAQDPGQIAPTVKSMRVMLSSGEIETVSPTVNPELFGLVLGGYGLFGVILDAELEVTQNEVYEWITRYMDYADFPTFYAKNVEGKDNIGLAYGRLSVSPDSYLRETAFHIYQKQPWAGPVPALQPVGHDWFLRLVLNLSKTGDWGRRVRWGLEKHVEKEIYPCLSRNQAMIRGEGCFVTRNHEMSDSMSYLKDRLEDTDILQEYFIPHARMVEFVDGLRSLTTEDSANLLNVTIRIVHRDKITALPYAKEDMFAFVLYFNQRLDEADSQRLRRVTIELIDLALRLNGTYYLPYQLYYSSDQLRAAYPEIDQFFAAKTKYDPTGLFTNKFYEKYGPSGREAAKS